MENVIIPPTNPTSGFIVSDGDRNHRNHQNHEGLTTKDRLALDGNFLTEALTAISVEIEKNGRSAELATEKTGAATQLSVEKTAAGSQLASSLAFANTQNLLISGFKDGRFDAAVNAAAVALTGAVNTAAIQKNIDECCCEIREKIVDDGEKTRDLVSAINAANLATQLVDAKNEVNLLKFKYVPTAQ